MKVTILPKDRNGWFVHVTEQEALEIITSLSTQLEKKNPNHSRAEQRTEKGEYFSIGVDFEEEEDVNHMKARIDMLEHDNQMMDDFWGDEFRRKSKVVPKKKAVKKKTAPRKKQTQRRSKGKPNGN